MADTSTPASVAAGLAGLLAGLNADEIASVLASHLAPEALAPVEAALAAASERAHKRRLYHIDVRDDALGRPGTMRAMIELFGRGAGIRVCRRWRDTARQAVPLTTKEEAKLCRAIVRGEGSSGCYDDPHLLANLGYYDIRALTFRGEEDDDAIH